MHKRINYLEKKYSYLSDNRIFVNSISKHFARNSHNSLLSSICECGTKNARKNLFYNGIGFLKDWAGITVFLDSYIDKKFLKYKSNFNVALLLESKFIKPDVYKRIYELADEFDLILTHDQEILINFEKKAKYVPPSSVSIGSNYCGTNFRYKKNIVSFNYSEKKKLPGHKLRHLIAERYQDFDPDILHKLGSGPQGVRIIEKGEMLKTYKFSICIENSLYPDYFTEKIIDCFVSGVVPIYWGTSNIHKFFNKKGILQFNTLEELDEIMNRISYKEEEIYNSMKSFISENYKISRKYLLFDDIHLLEIIDFIKNNKSSEFFKNIISAKPSVKYKNWTFGVNYFLNRLLDKL